MRGGAGDGQGESVSYTHGADSEAGWLRTVLVHRPGAELKRISPRSRGRLLFDRLPWVARAQQEHDAFTQILRDHGVEVLYVTELLQDALEYAAGPGRRDQLGAGRPPARRRSPRRSSASISRASSSEMLAQALIAGITPGELSAGRGVVYELLDRHDFVLDPLPNLMFTRDSSVWIGDRVAVSSLGARDREARLLAVLYAHHPRFAGTKMLYGPHLEPIAGGDIVLLAPGVIAVGVSEQTSPAGVERLARHAFAAGLAHTVLAMPIHRTGAAHLDMICTVIGQRGHRDASRARLHADRAQHHVPRRRAAGVAAPAVPGRRGPGHRDRPAHRDRHRAGSAHRPARPGWWGASGTTAATRCPSAAGWPSAMSGAWRPTPGSPRPESRSSRCPPASWAAAGAVRAACRAR